MRWTPDFAFLDADPLTLAIWVVGGMAALYLARRPAHEALRAAGRALHVGLRLTARSLMLAEQALTSRNREVLLSEGTVSLEHDIEREHSRIAAAVERDVSAFPALQRRLSDLAFKLDEDYRTSSDVPPSPPGWVDAVEAVAGLARKGEAPVASILEQIHATTVTQHDQVLDAYRREASKRHAVLDRMQPSWREAAKLLEKAAQKVKGVQERAQIVDERLDRYERIRMNTNQAERVLASSALTQFAISALVLVIAIGGAVINFNLIALPMSEMVGGGSYIGDWKTSDVAALVIILVEVAMGLYLMEALRITHLFPVIGQLDDRLRRRMAWVAFGLLFVLAGIESSLAFMRDRIAADIQALRQSLADVDSQAAPTSIIPTAGQMLMGFILPFALTFVAIPLETFIHSARHVLGAGLALILRWSAFLLRLLGSAAVGLAETLVKIYDVAIFLPLWIENLMRRGGEPETTATADRSGRSSHGRPAVSTAAKGRFGGAGPDSAGPAAGSESETEEVLS